MTYVYDFGDNWEVKITVIEIGKCRQKMFALQCGGFGVAPIEDSGGIDGWGEVCESLVSEDKDKKQGTLDWIKEIEYEVDADLENFDKDYCSIKNLKNNDSEVADEYI